MSGRVQELIRFLDRDASKTHPDDILCEEVAEWMRSNEGKRLKLVNR